MPELVDGKWTIRRSEVTDFKRSPAAWYWRYIQGYHKKVTDAAGPLELGTWWHRLLEAGLKAVQAQDKTLEEGESDFYVAATNELDLLRSEVDLLIPSWMCPLMLQLWYSHISMVLPDFKLFLVEEKLYLPLPMSWQSTWPGLVLTCTLDAGLTNGVSRYIDEHKTSGSSVWPEALDAHYQLDEQVSLYNLIFNYNYLGPEVTRALVDVTRKQDPHKKITAPVIGHTIQVRDLASRKYIWEDLEQVIADMERTLELLPFRRPQCRCAVHPISRMCPGDFQPVCDALLHGENHQDVLDRLYERSTDVSSLSETEP